MMIIIMMINIINLLLQMLNFKLFGFPYFVGIIKFSLFFPWDYYC